MESEASTWRTGDEDSDIPEILIEFISSRTMFE